MRQRTRVFLILLLIAIAIYWVAAARQRTVSTSTVEFTADFVETWGNKINTQGRVYCRGNLVRLDLNGGDLRQNTIWRTDLGVVWSVFPNLKAYSEETNGSANRTWDWELDSKIADKRYAGSETISGQRCRKYFFTYRDKRMGSQRVWVSVGSGWPVRTEYRKTGAPTRVVEFSNFTGAPLPVRTFDVPVGYKKMTPGEVVDALRKSKASRGLPTPKGARTGNGN